ncbi:Breast cancer type 2 susceptibility [Globisporangium polare]
MPRMDVGVSGGRSSNSNTVPSLFQTGSGRAVEISKEKLRDYESKWRAEEMESQSAVVHAAEDDDRRASLPSSSGRRESASGGVAGDDVASR